MSPNVEPAVFLNCPYDVAFRPLFDAMFLTCVWCGFVPRSATDSGSSGTPRIERILAALQACPYSIHDLSRCRGEGDGNLARFNMPLELGMALMLGAVGERSHEWMALAPEGPRHEQYASDLSGYDLERYDGSQSRIVNKVTAWLLTREAAVAVPVEPVDILTALPVFTEALEALFRRWLGPPSWAARVRVARETILAAR